MQRILVTVATLAELAKMREKAIAPQPTPGFCRMICLLDMQENETLPHAQQGELVCRAQELFSGSFYHEAFFFSKEEFRTRCGLLLCEKLLAEGNQVLLQHPAYSLHTEMLVQPEADEILGIGAPVISTKGLSVSIVLEQTSSLLMQSLSLGSGAKVLAFLRWCNKRFRWVFQTGKPAWFSIAERNGVALLQRNFTTTFLSFAPLFGCRLRSVCTEKRQEKAIMPQSAYRFANFTDGTPIFDLLRDYYGRDVRLQENCGDTPFDKLSLFFAETFLTGDIHPVPIPPAAQALYVPRDDLQHAFPDETRSHREAYVQWFLNYGAAELQLPKAAIAPLAARLQEYQQKNAQQDVLFRSFGYRVRQKLNRIFGRQSATQQVQYPFGINLCGFIKGDFGLGESARILARILEAGDIPFTVISSQLATGHSYNNFEFAHKISNQFLYNINIFDTNGDGMTVFIQSVAPEVLQNRYNIGYWAWELPEFPMLGWEEAFPMLDEVWTCSDFTSESVRQKSPIPVYTIPHAITVEVAPQKTRADFGLPTDKFVFLMMYDVRSFSARKNPQAAVKAFLEAFENDNRACLLMKLNTPADWDGEDELLDSLRQSSNVLTYSGQMPKEELNALIACCDAYVSLHRSEGFGLGPAEAMYLGKPAILTNWSGNTQYMRQDACCAVDYTIVEIDKDYGPYKKGYHWAEPDVHCAARLMRRLVEEPAYYKQIAQAGQALIRNEFSPHAVSRLVAERLRAIDKR